MVLGGTVALTVGVGVGMRWLLTTGLSWPTVIGLTFLVIGVTLVTAGSMRIVRNRRTVLGWLVLPLIWVGVAVIVWTLSPALIATIVPPTPHALPLIARRPRQRADRATCFAALPGVRHPPSFRKAFPRFASDTSR